MTRKRKSKGGQAKRRRREHVIHKVQRHIVHATANEARAKAPAFAGKWNQVLVTTGLAFTTRKAVLKNSAAQIPLKLSLYEAWQTPVLADLLHKLRPIARHRALEQRLLHASRSIDARSCQHASLSAALSKACVQTEQGKTVPIDGHLGCHP